MEDNSIEYTTYTEKTLEPVLALIRERFAENDVAIVQRILENPLRAERPAAGDVVLVGGKAVCFSAMLAKRAWLGSKSYEVSVGAFFSKSAAGCPPEYLLDVFDLVKSGGNQSDLMLGNTCIYRVAALARQCGWASGPASWETTRYAILKPLLFASLVAWRKLLKRPQPPAPDYRPPSPDAFFAKCGELEVHHDAMLDLPALAAFWETYLATNQGLVLSRTPAELKWLFEADISKRKTVFLSLRRNKIIEGYIALHRLPDSPRRWRVYDLIALDNNPERLELLLKGAKNFLRRQAGAITLEITGFPDRIQPLIRRLFPFKIQRGYNPYIWIARRPETAECLRKAITSQEGWFFGPYDGEYCL
ncbi:MAG: hypothetical protein GX945_08035 [Lentisphaerae bacterium]|nr:hypothetical protein [Lentisphaerota bacterium]